MVRKIFYLFVLILMSCSTSKVVVDYDSEINFSNFNTYYFYDDVGEGLNELDVKRVIKAFNLELKLKGFQEVENPDFYVNVIVNITEIQNNNTIGIGIGSGGNNGGFGISGGIPLGSKKFNELFTVEFVNAKTKTIFWEARLNTSVRQNRTPEEKTVHFQKIIKKILEKYPPK
jgi:hypothetical protein